MSKIISRTLVVKDKWMERQTANLLQESIKQALFGHLRTEKLSVTGFQCIIQGYKRCLEQGVPVHLHYRFSILSRSPDLFC